jgi:hypothetical protein
MVAVGIERLQFSAYRARKTKQIVARAVCVAQSLAELSMAIILADRDWYLATAAGRAC